MQFDALWPDVTAREHLATYARIKGYSGDRLKGEVDSMLKKMSLENYADKLAGDFSGGNKRKLSVAIALLAVFGRAFHWHGPRQQTLHVEHYCGVHAVACCRSHNSQHGGGRRALHSNRYYGKREAAMPRKQPAPQVEVRQGLRRADAGAAGA
jgi:hypothetical protein